MKNTKQKNIFRVLNVLNISKRITKKIYKVSLINIKKKDTEMRELFQIRSFTNDNNTISLNIGVEEGEKYYYGSLIS